MATIKINIEKHEKDKLIIAIAKNKGAAASIATISKSAGLNPNRARFIMEDLIEDGAVRKTVLRKFNDKYIRYSYEITGK